MKHRIIRALDIAGLRVFEPVVRLCCGEEPRVQAVKIAKLIVVPILVFAVFLWVWSVAAPRHRTKYGEVPTPAVVWDAYRGIESFHVRENTREADYDRRGPDRLAAIERVKAELAVLEPIAAEAGAAMERIKAEADAALRELVAPMQAEYERMREASRAAQQERESAITAAAGSIAPSDAESKSKLLADMIAHEAATASERRELDAVKAEINAALAAKQPAVLAAQRELSVIEEQRMFLTTRLQRLESDNREVRTAEAERELADLRDRYAAAGGAELVALGRSITRTEDRLANAAANEPAGPWTFFEQVGRSLACVFLGFAIAALIAIPLGILCGLSPVAMASMTPLISLFKPVSPIVWLPIVLIIVGGFFTNPETAWVQPSFLASAITVALCSMWPTLTNTALGVAAIDKDHLNVARVLRLGFFTRLRKIVIPSALPLIFAGLRISLGVGWMVLIAAELLSSSEGIGKFVWDMFNNGSSQTFAQMFVVVFFVGVIGMMLDRAMIVMQRLVSFDDAKASV